MARKESTFIIGLFVTIGFLIGVVAVVWLGAEKYFQKGALYVTYFDESVQGIEVGTSVKYRGVDIGRVEKVEVAPDERLIGVVMSIGRKEVVAADTEAQLRTAGLTGIGFVNLYPKPRGEPDLSPKLTFKPKYPVIPSHPSEMSQVLSGVNEIMEKLKKVDFEGISYEVKTTAAAAGNLFGGKRTAVIMANIESVSARLDGTIQTVDDLIRDEKVKGILVDTRETLVETRALVGELRNEVKSMKLAEQSEKAGALVEGLDRRTREITIAVKATGENLRHASETLDMLLERLYSDPSNLIFSGPPPRRGEGRGKER